MTDQSIKNIPQFFVTASAPCPYLPDREERKIFTTLDGPYANAFHNQLATDGFRRSQRIAYKPACEHCRACISVRILVDEYLPSRSCTRIMKRNIDLHAEQTEAIASQEQYSLLRDYLDTRHAEGGMAEMSVLDYANMVEETTVNTQIIEYKSGSPISAKNRPLVATALTDKLDDGLSMVYSFYGPQYSKRSLGTYLILDHIKRAKSLGLPYVYLGYWIDGCQKMEYKTRFRPLERLEGRQWVRYE